MENRNFDYISKINFITSEIDGLYHQASVKLGLNDSTSRVLYTLIKHSGSCLISDIYKQSGIGKQTVNSALRKLEEDGIINLEQFDGRSKKVIFTDKGKEYANETIIKLIAAETKAYEQWSESEITQYLELSRKFMQTLREEVKKL